MSILLTMAQPLEALLVKTSNDLQKSIMDAAVVEYHKNETPVATTWKLSTLIAEYKKVESDLISLRALRTAANCEVFVDWESDLFNSELCITEAIELAKSMRRTLALYEKLAGMNPNVVSVGNRYDKSADNLRKITFNPEVFKKEADELRKSVNALSFAIDLANQQTTIDFDASPYLSGLSL